MSTMKIKLVQGRSYHYKGHKFFNGVVKGVLPSMGKYLLKSGKFVQIHDKPENPDKEKAEGKTKVRIRKPEPAESGEDSGEGKGKDSADETDSNPEELEIPSFRSKKDLAAWAEEEHGYVFEEDLKALKMYNMESSIKEYVKVKSKEQEALAQAEKEGAVVV